MFHDEASLSGGDSGDDDEGLDEVDGYEIEENDEKVYY